MYTKYRIPGRVTGASAINGASPISPSLTWGGLHMTLYKYLISSGSGRPPRSAGGTEERGTAMNDYGNDGPDSGRSDVGETPGEAGAVGRPPQPVPWPPVDWRCLRWTGISGRYSGTANPSTILLSERLELRLDVDTRYSATSPVMNKVSGDHFTRTFRPNPPGFGPEVYSYSWIVDTPVVTWARCSATITGNVRFFSGSRPPTTV